MRPFLATGLILSCLCALAFWRVLDADFINFDDDLYVYENPDVSNGLSQEGLVHVFTQPIGSIYQPLTLLSLMLDASLWGLDPFGFHLTNLLLHILNVWLLLWLLYRYTNALWPAAIVAAVFALHPLRTESVAWVTERKDLLSALFFFLSLLFWRRYSQSEQRMPYLAVMLCFVFGLLSKQIIVTLPIVLLLLDYWPVGRLADKKAGWLLVEKLPLFALALAFGLLALWLVTTTGSAASVHELAFDVRIGNALVCYVRYLGKFFWPTDLAIFYPHPENSLPLWQIVGASVVLVGVTGLCFWQRRKRPYLLVGWLWYVVMLLPMSGIFQAGSQAMADRFTYLPQIGVALALVWWVNSMMGVVVSARVRAYLVSSAVAFVVVGLAAVTFFQTAHWKDSVSVFQHALSVGQQHHFIHNNLGLAFYSRQEYGAAQKQLQLALARKPDDALIVMNLGLVAQAQGKRDKALALFQRAVRLDPDLADAYNNLALAFFLRGDYAQAWQNVFQCLKRRGRPHPGFLRDLAAKAPPPESIRKLLGK